MTEALFNKSDVCVVSPTLIAELKEKAQVAPRRRFRLCMHRSHQDLVQEMIIVFCQDSHIPIHRHVGNRSESFHVIEGDLTVLLYDNDGTLVQEVKLGQPGSGRASIYRVSSPLWHTVRLESEFVVLHETGTGPFDPQRQEEPPNWVTGR